ncbi:hypothetical protein PAHAL_9G455900 [Panicum hallii]|uniref:Uncharacterized protein n=1 Tax=Panicum hallii TaxID=206008 RepID=A0A2T8I4S3_9POAL|nr:hypothetical protein PAHAL_9G455900 [Panicum hallii]
MLNDVEHVIGCIKATPFILPGRGGDWYYFFNSFAADYHSRREQGSQVPSERQCRRTGVFLPEDNDARHGRCRCLISKSTK